MLKAKRFQEFDFGDPVSNSLKYGQDTPPEIDLGSIEDAKIAIFTGTEDELSDLGNSRWIKRALKKENLVFYKEYELGHLSFMVGKDMSYFTKDAMAVLKMHHPLPKGGFLKE